VRTDYGTNSERWTTAKLDELVEVEAALAG